MTRKTAFFEGWSWFKLNNLGVAPGTNLKFYTSLSKGLKLKVRKFFGLIPTFVEVTGEKLVGGPFCHPPSPPTPILNRVKQEKLFQISIVILATEQSIKSSSFIFARFCLYFKSTFTIKKLVDDFWNDFSRTPHDGCFC